jgi:hypothetical protein
MSHIWINGGTKQQRLLGKKKETRSWMEEESKQEWPLSASDSDHHYKISSDNHCSCIFLKKFNSDQIAKLQWRLNAAAVYQQRSTESSQSTTNSTQVLNKTWSLFVTSHFNNASASRKKYEGVNRSKHYYTLLPPSPIKCRFQFLCPQVWLDLYKMRATFVSLNKFIKN